MMNVFFSYFLFSRLFLLRIEEEKAIAMLGLDYLHRFVFCVL